MILKSNLLKIFESEKLQFVMSFFIKLLSGDIIRIEICETGDDIKDIQNIKHEIKKKFYQEYKEYPLCCIILLKNEEKNEENLIDYFLYINNRIKLEYKFVKDALSSCGKRYEKYNIFKDDIKVKVLYRCKNYGGNEEKEEKCFVFGEDVKVIKEFETHEIIFFPTKYKNMKQIIETWFMEEFIVGNVDLTQLYLLGI